MKKTKKQVKSHIFILGGNWATGPG